MCAWRKMINSNAGHCGTLPSVLAHKGAHQMLAVHSSDCNPPSFPLQQQSQPHDPNKIATKPPFQPSLYPSNHPTTKQTHQPLHVRQQRKSKATPSSDSPAAFSTLQYPIGYAKVSGRARVRGGPSRRSVERYQARVELGDEADEEW